MPASPGHRHTSAPASAGHQLRPVRRGELSGREAKEGRPGRRREQREPELEEGPKASGCSRKGRDRRALSPEKGLGLPPGPKNDLCPGPPSREPSVTPLRGHWQSAFPHGSPGNSGNSDGQPAGMRARSHETGARGVGHSALGAAGPETSVSWILLDSQGKGGLLGQRGCGTAVKELMQSSTQKWHSLGPRWRREGMEARERLRFARRSSGGHKTLAGGGGISHGGPADTLGCTAASLLRALELTTTHLDSRTIHVAESAQ